VPVNAGFIAVGQVSQAQALRLIGAYGVIFFGVGGAPFQLRADIEFYTRLTGATLVGFSVLLGIGAFMADLGAWLPVPAAGLVVGVAIALHITGLVRAKRVSDRVSVTRGDAVNSSDEADEAERKRLKQILGYADQVPRRVSRELPDPARMLSAPSRWMLSALSRWMSAAPRWMMSALSRWMSAASRWMMSALSRWMSALSRWMSALSRRSQLSLLLTLVGTALWLVTALFTRDSSPGPWGMLAVLSPFWYVGLGLVIAGFVIGCRIEQCAALATVSFGLASTVTPALTYGTPQVQTAAKQMVLTDYVLEHHHIHVTSGIYPAFSALFSGIAWLCSLLGLHGLVGPRSLLGLATYWPVLILLMRIVVLRMLAGRLLPTPARRWTAVLLVLLLGALGQDYFSPQSVGYIMAFGVIGLVMYGRTPQPFGRSATFSLLLLSGVALGPTHELSPYLAAGALIVLAIFRQAPRWAWSTIAVPALAWAGVVHTAVSSSFSFSTLFDITNFRPPYTPATPGLSRLAVVGFNSHALLVALLLLMAIAAVGFFANVRSKRAWAYALCPIVGLSLIAINPYGNEGIFRATIFALPWLAILAMEMPPPQRLLPPLKHPAALIGATFTVLLTFCALFLPTSYAMDGVGVIRPSELALFDYLLSQPRTSNFVVGLGADIDVGSYPPSTVNYDLLSWDTFAKPLQLLTRHPTALTLTAFADAYGVIVTRYGATATSRLYVYYSQSMVQFSQAYGLMTPEQLRTWLRLLESSRNWQLVFHQADSYLFELR
jgi:hypothetical protein